MKKFIVVLLSFSLLILYGCADTVDIDADKQALTKLTVEDWDMNAKIGNVEAMVESYIDGALRIGNGAVLDGKEAIHNSLSFSLDRGITPDKLENKVEDIKLSGDLAIVRGSFEAVRSLKEGGAKIHQRGAWVDVCERQEDGDWKMALTLFTDVGEGSKKIAIKYHELNPDDIDDILTEDFIGHWGMSEGTWNRENHRQAWSNNKAEDKILHLVAEGDFVAIRFIRTGESEGNSWSIDIMQFMKFENGKIAEIWEMFDQNQLESEDE